MNQEEGDFILECTDCGSNRLRREGGDLVCQKCGLVLEESMPDESSSPQVFTHEERQRIERTGKPITYAKPRRGMSTEVGSGRMSNVSPSKRGQYYRMRKWQKRLEESKDRRLNQALRSLKSLVDVLDLPDPVLEESARLYEKALEEEIVKGRRIEEVAAALIYIVAKMQGTPRTLSEISEESQVSRRKLGETYRYVARELDLRIVPIDPLKLLPRYSQRLEVPGKVRLRASELIKESREKGLLAGRSPESVVASAIYLASILEDEEITQKRLAEAVGVTEVTVRNGYKNLVDGLELDV